MFNSVFLFIIVDCKEKGVIVAVHNWEASRYMNNYTIKYKCTDYMIEEYI